MLNTASKLAAAVAGCLSYLSYVCTGVGAAASGIYLIKIFATLFQAIEYLRFYVPNVGMIWGMIFVLTFFCVLCLAGLKESAWAAVFFSTVHVLTMIILMVFIFSHIYFMYRYFVLFLGLKMDGILL